MLGHLFSLDNFDFHLTSISDPDRECQGVKLHYRNKKGESNHDILIIQTVPLYFDSLRVDRSQMDLERSVFLHDGKPDRQTNTSHRQTKPTKGKAYPMLFTS